jgi:hypothetical protein
MPEVIALMVVSCLAAQRHSWQPDLLDQALNVVFDGLAGRSQASTDSHRTPKPHRRTRRVGHLHLQISDS